MGDGTSRLDREYMDEVLQLLATDAGYGPAGWDSAEIADFRLLVQCARAARTQADLRNMRLLRLRPYIDGGSETALAGLGSNRHIVLTFKNSGSHATVVFELLTPETEARR